MSDLKPCPHCNGPAHIVIGDEFCRIRCSQCGATGGPADAIRESDAIAAWNRRPTETPASGESDSGLVERLEEAANGLQHMPSTSKTIYEAAAEIRRLTEVAQDWCRDARHNESVADEWKRQYEKEHERAEKFMWQVRDTCARAEQAERERDEAREAAHYANGTAELAMKHRDTAEARVKELEEALDPFAAVAEHDIGEDEVDKDRFTPMVVNHRAPLITVGDLRRARAALKGEQFGAFGGEPRTDAMRRLLTEANARNGELRDALIDATAHLAAATSSYKRFCRKGVTGDALFSTKLSDYEKAEARARAALKGE